MLKYADGRSPLPSHRPTPPVGVYSAILVVTLALAFARFLVQDAGTVAAADRLHGALLHRLTHAPQAFIDATPRARILGWVTAELQRVDLDTCLVSEYFWFYTVGRRQRWVLLG